MSEQKTHAEIIAEMRYKAGVICPWQVNGGTCELCPLGHSPHGKDLGKYCSFHKLAHELDAAHRREVQNALDAGGFVEASRKNKQVGNAAKLREALIQCELFLGYVDRHGHPTLNPGDKCVACEDASKLRDMVNRALATPPRNCDLARDWIRDLYAHFQPPASVKREMPPEWVDAVMAFCRWLVATAQEGGAK